jgi:hypothetical protein
MCDHKGTTDSILFKAQRKRFESVPVMTKAAKDLGTYDHRAHLIQTDSVLLRDEKLLMRIANYKRFRCPFFF